MNRISLVTLMLSPIVLGMTALAPAASAAETMEQMLQYGENAGANRVGQVTSVSQLTDVKPSDWAFQALQSLVERYGCIVGYPDRTYRGNRALTRYEFAAGLNSCMDKVNELIAASTEGLAKKEDMDAMRKLQQEFADELAELKGRVDGLESKVSTLEGKQFSTTTKLAGEVIFGVAGALGNDRAITSDQQRAIDATPAGSAARTAAQLAVFDTAPRGISENTIFGNRVRLALDTSFTGKDRLRTRLQARNLTSFTNGAPSTVATATSTLAGSTTGGATGTAMTRLGFDGDSSNAVELNRLEYRFPLTPLTTVFVGGGSNDGLEFNDIVPTLSPTESSGSGSISRFGRFNPIYRANAGSGVVINQKLGGEFSAGEKVTISAGYLVPSNVANNPAVKNGISDGTHTLLGQIAIKPLPNLGIALTYANSYYSNGAGISGGTGTSFANNPFAGAATSTNAYGISAELGLGKKMNLSGWAGYTKAISRENINTVASQGTATNRAVNNGDDATIWNWSVAATFPDAFKEGNLAGIIFGMPPRVTENDFGPSTGGVTNGRRDRDASYHVEGFYRWRLSDRIAITPGLLMILNPEGNKTNDTIYVGTIRTTLTF
jgi:Carbohydrate-selective porin, OprB family/S-layer homology domain